jgi:CRISPR-associated protein (TIGR02710 family)
MSQPNILLCTVGTGTFDQLRETLLEPLKKSIRKGDWQRVVLLPSQLTTANAALLQQEIQDVPIEIQPLPQAGMEDDPDECFAHFDRLLSALCATGATPDSILVDFTRGTKVMSAALVLAAVRHDLPRVRYISGPRGPSGMVQAGQEVVADFHTAVVSAHKRLDEVHQFFRHGNFAGALALLTGLGYEWPADLQPLAARLTRWAEFYSAWDRLDYKRASTMPPDAQNGVPASWSRFAPTAAMCASVARLAEPFPADCPGRAARLRFQVLDLLASAERRLRDHHFEDAIIRAYRIVEMVGQVRLFDHGLDAGALPAEHPAVITLQDKLRKKKDDLMTEVRGRPGFLQAARLQAARLLKVLKDCLAARLLTLGNHGFITKRNKGVLIHGFEPLGSTDAAMLRAFLQELELLLHEDGRLAGFDTAANLQVARSCTFAPSTHPNL